MFLSHTYHASPRPPYDGAPAIEVERFIDSAEGVASFVEFLSSIFGVEECPVVDLPDQPRPAATLIMLEKVHLQLEQNSLYIVCQKAKTRDRILERLLEHRLEWARVLGPMRFKLRENFWTDRHSANTAWAVFLDLIVIGIVVMLLNGIYLEDGIEDSLLWLAFFLLATLWPNFQLTRRLWTLHLCRAGAIDLPAELELTDRMIVGVLREEAFTGARVVDIDLDEIEKLWFLTERPLSGGGRVRKKFRWRHRREPFEILLGDDVCITGLRIRAAGRTYTLWVDRFNGEFGDDYMRALCTGIQQSVRERLFPLPEN